MITVWAQRWGAARVASNLTLAGCPGPALDDLARCRREGPTRAEDAGYVLIDALVALLILSAIFVLSFVALQTAQGTALRAEEVRSAELLIRSLMMDGPRSLMPASGVESGFAWSLATAPTATIKPVAVCTRQVSIRNNISSRTYGAATLEACPVQDP